MASSFFTITCFGVLLGYLGWRAPSLWAPITLHAANNLWSTGVLSRLPVRVLSEPVFLGLQWPSARRRLERNLHSDADHG